MWSVHSGIHSRVVVHSNVVLCPQELASLIPDIGSSRVQEVPPYNGSRDCTRIMLATRSKFDQLEAPSFGAGTIVTVRCAMLIVNEDEAFRVYIHMHILLILIMAYHETMHTKHTHAYHTCTCTGSSSSLQGTATSTSSYHSQSSITNHSTSTTRQSSQSSTYRSRTGSARSRDRSNNSETTLTRQTMDMLSTIDPEADNSFDDDSYDDSG